MYALIAFLFRPTVSTKYPLAQKCLFPYLYFRFACRSNIIRLLFPFRYPIIWDTLYFGRMLISIWMRSFFTLTRRLFLVFFSPRHRLFLPGGLFLVANTRRRPPAMVGGHKKVISYFLWNGVASVTPFPVSAVLPQE